MRIKMAVAQVIAHLHLGRIQELQDVVVVHLKCNREIRIVALLHTIRQDMLMEEVGIAPRMETGVAGHTLVADVQGMAKGQIHVADQITQLLMTMKIADLGVAQYGEVVLRTRDQAQLVPAPTPGTTGRIAVLGSGSTCHRVRLMDSVDTRAAGLRRRQIMSRSVKRDVRVGALV